MFLSFVALGMSIAWGSPVVAMMMVLFQFLEGRICMTPRGKGGHASSSCICNRATLSGNVFMIVN